MKRKSINLNKQNKKKKEEKQPAPQVLSYDEIIVKSLEFRIAYVSSNMKSCGLDCVLKYAFDVDKIHENKVKEVAENQGASKVMLASFSRKYEVSDPSLDQPEEEQQSKPDDDHSGYDSNDNDEDDDDEDDDNSNSEDDLGADDADKRFETLMTTKGNHKSEFRIYVSTDKLPVVNLYARFSATLKQKKETVVFKFPPDFDDMVILGIVNDFKRKPAKADVVLKGLIKAAPWASNKLRDALNRANNMGNKNEMLRSKDFMYTLIKDSSLFPLVECLFDDLFHCDEFAWVTLNFPDYNLRRHPDPDEHACDIYHSILDGKLDKYAFAGSALPLSVSTFLWRLKGEPVGDETVSYMMGLTDEDTETFKELYQALEDDYIEANNLWVHYRKNITLKYGRFVWNLDKFDTYAYKPVTEVGLEKAVDYLSENGQALLTKDNQIIPLCFVSHWAMLLQTAYFDNDVVELICAEQIGKPTAEFVSQLVQNTCNMTFANMHHIRFLCPTKQSANTMATLAASKTKKDLNITTIDVLMKDSVDWIEALVGDKRSVSVVVISDAHMWSTKQMMGFLKLLCEVVCGREETTDNHGKLRVVFCGVATVPIHNEMQTPNAGFAHMLTCNSNKEADPLKMIISIVDVESSRIDADYIQNKAVVIRNPEGDDANNHDNGEAVTHSTKDLHKTEMHNIVLRMTDILKENTNRKICFLFENEWHMNQIINHALYANPICSQFFNTDVLKKDDHVIEADGGMAKVKKIYINNLPGVKVNLKEQAIVNLKTTPSCCIYYSLADDAVYNAKDKPITHSKYACLSKCRFGPIDNMLYVCVFSGKDRKFNESELNYLTYLGMNNVVVITVDKKYGSDVRPMTLIANPNMFDLTLVKFAEEQQAAQAQASQQDNKDH
jgi:hypothetical protein